MWLFLSKFFLAFLGIRELQETEKQGRRTSRIGLSTRY